MYVGTLMTSLEMAGVSISLLQLEGNSAPISTELLDCTTNASGWPRSLGIVNTQEERVCHSKQMETKVENAKATLSEEGKNNLL